MADSKSITIWLGQLRAGEDRAAALLWERYFLRLVGFARHKLGSAPKADSNEEDIALSAFKSLCVGIRNGRFPKLQDRDALWPLLVVITSRKACDQITRQRRLKRGGGFIQRAGHVGKEDEGLSPLELLASEEPTPESIVEMEEECAKLLGMLDETCQRIALLKLEGFSNEEISTQVGLAPRSIERKLAWIRTVWSKSHE